MTDLMKMLSGGYFFAREKRDDDDDELISILYRTDIISSLGWRNSWRNFNVCRRLLLRFRNVKMMDNNEQEVEISIISLWLRIRKLLKCGLWMFYRIKNSKFGWNYRKIT